MKKSPSSTDNRLESIRANYRITTAGAFGIGEYAVKLKFDVRKSPSNILNNGMSVRQWWRQAYRDLRAAGYDPRTGKLVSIEQNQRWKKETTMTLSAAELLEKSGGGVPLLHGSDLKQGQTKVVIKVKAVREAPDGFNSPLILDIEEVNGKEAWAVNKTNLRALAATYGDNVEKLVGKRIPLHVALVNNPKTNKMTRSLFVVAPEED